MERVVGSGIRAEWRRPCQLLLDAQPDEYDFVTSDEYTSEEYGDCLEIIWERDGLLVDVAITPKQIVRATPEIGVHLGRIVTAAFDSKGKANTCARDGHTKIEDVPDYGRVCLDCGTFIEGAA